MKEWYRGLTPTSKGMLLLVIVLLVAIATRWSYIRSEASQAIEQRIKLDDFRVK